MKYWFAYAKEKCTTKEWDTAKNILKIACREGDCSPRVFIALCESELRAGNLSRAQEFLNERAQCLPPSASIYLHCKELFGDIYDNPLEFTSKALISRRSNSFSFIDCAVRNDDMRSPIYDVDDYCRTTVPKLNSFASTVYVFGASQVYGIWNENKNTVASFLQSLFCSHNREIRVVNMGVHNQHHPNHYLLFKRLALKKNDCVIILPHTPRTKIKKSYFSSRIQFFQVMAAECQAKGVRFAVFHLPTILDIRNPSSREEITQNDQLAHYPMFVDNHKQARKSFKRTADLGFEFHSLGNLMNRPHDMGEVFVDSLHYNHRANKRIAEKVFAVLSSSAPEISPLPLSDDIRANTLRTAIEYLGKVASEKYAPNPDVASWIESVRNPAFAGLSTIGAIVMNCNPFTWGHHYLIEQAARQVDGLYIFVVEEDKSFFPFEDRIRLVREGVKALGEKISIHPSGKFIISNLSFSGYFSKERAIKPADSTTDVLIFGSVIAPALNIRHRFVGEEPNCLVTNSYNETMDFLLPSLGVDLHIIPRKEDVGQVISATTVRKALQERDWDTIRQIVPPSTYDYLIDRFQKEPIPSG